MREEKIYTAVTDSTVTLYWRRPWNFGIRKNERNRRNRL